MLSLWIVIVIVLYTRVDRFFFFSFFKRHSDKKVPNGLKVSHVKFFLILRSVSASGLMTKFRIFINVRGITSVELCECMHSNSSINVFLLH